MSTALLVVTLVWPDWIELVFHIDPDEGSGALEWLIVALVATVAIACFALARLQWQRAHARLRQS